MSEPTLVYEIFTASFCDSNHDGIGDLQGIISRLDYLQHLGVDCIWLTPVNPSPTYHKYDVIDYFKIDPSFGTLDDYRQLITQAHQAGIKVMMDLVINHTSDQHPWFMKALLLPENKFHDYYIWMHPNEIEARGIALREGTSDTEQTQPWHAAPGFESKYYGAFWKGMPDLNFNSEKLKAEIRKIIHFWLIDVGVDGFRLDAARHIFPHWEKEKNPIFWQEFKEWIEETGKEGFTVGEVWAQTHETAPYLKGLKSVFNFDLQNLLQKTLTEEKDTGLIESLNTIYQQYETQNPDFIDSIFLSNHDQNRIASVLGNDRRKIKLAASLLLTLPGLPYIYYGEELGMTGEKPDPFIREPFLWSDNLNDTNLTKVIDPCHNTPDTLRPLNLQVVADDSVFNHYKTLISLRKSEPSLSNPKNYQINSLKTNDDQLLAYERPHPKRSTLIIHNLGNKNKTIRLSSKPKTILFSNSVCLEQPATDFVLSAYSTLLLLIEFPDKLPTFVYQQNDT